MLRRGPFARLDLPLSTHRVRAALAAPPPGPPLWSIEAPVTTSRAWTMFHHDASTPAPPPSPSHNPALVWRFRTAGEVWGSPRHRARLTVYIGSTDGKVYAIDGHTGTPAGASDVLRRLGAGPAVAPDGTVYATSVDHHLYAIRGDGQLVWSVETGNCSFSSPTIAPDGTVFIGSNDRKLYAVGADGRIRLTLPTGGGIASSPTLGADGTVYVGTDRRTVVVVAPTGQVVRELTTEGSAPTRRSRGCPAPTGAMTACLRTPPNLSGDTPALHNLAISLTPHPGPPAATRMAMLLWTDSIPGSVGAPPLGRHLLGGCNPRSAIYIDRGPA